MFAKFSITVYLRKVLFTDKCYEFRCVTVGNLGFTLHIRLIDSG